MKLPKPEDYFSEEMKEVLSNPDDYKSLPLPVLDEEEEEEEEDEDFATLVHKDTKRRTLADLEPNREETFPTDMQLEYQIQIIVYASVFRWIANAYEHKSSQQKNVGKIDKEWSLKAQEVLCQRLEEDIEVVKQQFAKTMAALKSLPPPKKS